MTAPQPPVPDEKDWTWVLGSPCPECGLDTTAIGRSDVPRLIQSAVTSFQAALARPDATIRPSPAVWSPVEYGCHVRDVCRLFDERLRLMLVDDDPLFANWNQDTTAVEQQYWAQDPADVATAFAEAAGEIAAAFGALDDEQWTRTGRRSDDAEFTVDTFSRYLVHDLLHHVHDVDTNTFSISGNLS